MDILTNQLNAPVVADPTAPYGISKYAKSYLDALKSNVEANVTKANAQAQIVKAYVEAEVARVDASHNELQAAANQAMYDAANDRTTIRQELNVAVAGVDASLNAFQAETASNFAGVDASFAQISADLASGLASAQTAASDAVAVERARLDALEQWKTSNTDEIATEVDKAINSKVSQLSFETIKADLEAADSQISQNLAAAITARTDKDAEHDELFERMTKFVNTLLSSYTLVDADGTPINSFADVVLVPPPALIWALSNGVSLYTSTTYTVTADQLDNISGAVVGSKSLVFKWTDANTLVLTMDGVDYTLIYDASISTPNDNYKFYPQSGQTLPDSGFNVKLLQSGILNVNNVDASSLVQINTVNMVSV